MAEDEAVLVPVEERMVTFYEDQIVAVVVDEGDERRIYVPMRTISQYLGLDWASQYRRIQRDPVLNEAMRGVVITTTPTEGGASGGRQEMLCLPAELLQGWLFGVQVSRVKEELREKILRYQRECYRVLHEAFRPDLSLPERTSEVVIQAMRDNALQQARLWETILTEQRRSRATETLVQEHDELLWQAFGQLEELRQQQSRLAAQFNDVVRLLPAPTDAIGPAQKAAIKALVDDLVAAAQMRGVRLGQGRNDYPAVWDAFKRRFDLAKYDELPVARYEEAVVWLKAWLNRIQVPSAPSDDVP